jgi:hypothetical protein
MAGEELQELARVALIGFQRQRREPLFVSERAQPLGAGGDKVGPGDDEIGCHVFEARSIWAQSVARPG